MRPIAFIFAAIAFWFSGAWWDSERPAGACSLMAAIVAALIGASLGGCETVRALGDACREGLCR